MKTLLILLSLSVSALIFGQKREQFLIAYNVGNKNGLSAVSEDTEDFHEGIELTFTEKINIYIARNLDNSKVFGEGKSSTLLSLKFGRDGILTEISTIGENANLNVAAENLFSPLIGKQLITSENNAKIVTEYNIPIVIKH